MKTVCAWCDKIIRVTCPHCHGPLAEANYPGSTYAAAYVCLTGETPITYSMHAVREMQASHGVCQSCADLTPAQRDAILKEKRGPTMLPQSATTPPPRDPKKSGGR